MNIFSFGVPCVRGRRYTVHPAYTVLPVGLCTLCIELAENGFVVFGFALLVAELGLLLEDDLLVLNRKK